MRTKTVIDRALVERLVAEGLSREAVARALCVSTDTITRRLRETDGEPEPEAAYPKEAEIEAIRGKIVETTERRDLTNAEVTALKTECAALNERVSKVAALVALGETPADKLAALRLERNERESRLRDVEEYATAFETAVTTLAERLHLAEEEGLDYELLQTRPTALALAEEFVERIDGALETLEAIKTLWYRIQRLATRDYGKHNPYFTADNARHAVLSRLGMNGRYYEPQGDEFRWLQSIASAARRSLDHIRRP